MEQYENNGGRNKFSISDRIRSFRNAFSGLGTLLRNEHNFRIHVLIMLLVIIAGFILKISPAEWIMIALASGLVISAECFNTALEYISDEVTSEKRRRIKMAKDVAAAGVLAAAFFAVITGLIIFIPRIVPLILR